MSFQRISLFVRRNDFVGALKLALSFYNQTARGVLGILILIFCIIVNQYRCSVV